MPLVLLAEDHADTREMDTFALTSAGYAVIEAADGSDAIVNASGKVPDVVVSDLRRVDPCSRPAY